MKKIAILLSGVILSQAVTMDELFEGLKQQYITKIDNINAKKAIISEQKVKSNYYPKIDLFGSYTHYNSPTGLKPIDPIETAKLTKNDDALPFSQNIEKIGIKLSIPIFMKELSSLSQKAKFLAKNAKLKKRLNFYENEAVIVAQNASLEYLNNLLIALNKTKESLMITRKELEIAVNSGRKAGISIDKIDEKLNSLDISINNINIKKESLIANIENLTGIELKNSVSMIQISDIKKDEIFALKPLKEVLNASNMDYQASKEKRYYPKVAFNMMWSENYTSDTINNKNDNEGYGYYQIALTMPLFDKSNDMDIQLKKIKLLKDKLKFQKTKHSLTIEAKKLQKELEYLDLSKKLSLKNIENRKKLLKYAKIAFEEGRMTEEDYLIYEDKLLQARANYYEVIAQHWQNLAKLAVIYGNNLKGIIK